MDLDDLATLRREYRSAGLDESEVDPDPVAQFRAWFAAWREVAVGEPNAMVVSTATLDGRPSVRTVLLKGIVGGDFVFYTNYESRKGRELTANPRAALLFSWHPVGRQVIIEGGVARVSPAESDAYWAGRPRGSQVGAAASPQSRWVPDRAALDALYAAVGDRHPGQPIPRPDHWGGFRLHPERFELWQGGEDRVHDRLVYRRDAGSPSGWRVERLAP